MARVRLKLLIDMQKRKVVFAEGGKDFIDFLFTIFTLPIGAVVMVLGQTEMVGSLGKLYESVQNLDQTYMQPNMKKDTLLNPIYLRGFLLPILEPSHHELSSISNDGNYVRDATTYMIMDDLVVEPVSTISSISLLTRLNVMEIGALEEKTIDFGKREFQDLLKASLRSDTVLTDAFLPTILGFKTEKNGD